MTHDLVDLGEFVADGRLRPQRADPVALRAVLDATKDDLVAAATVVTTSPSWAETMLDEAGLRTARVIVQAAGCRIVADRGHVTAIDAADALTDGGHHRRFVRLRRMRRMRHEFMYETRHPPSAADLAQARVDVEVLLAVAEAAIAASTV
jgi:hypothetical protein